MSSPELTVFTPFYKANPVYFDETIVSVLSQSFRDFEYLMINDGPVEDARRIEEKFRDPRIRIITTSSPLGLSGSRNAGLHEARADLIAFIDSDDFCEPGRMQKQIEFMRSHPDHVLVGAGLRYIDEKSQTIGSRTYPENDSDIKKRMVAINCIAQPAAMARRQALIDAGGYTNEFPCAEDYALWLRLARFGKFHNLQESLVAYRIHLDSGKHRLLRPALRDSTRLKVKALRDYGFRPNIRALLSIAAHYGLLAMPDRVVYWLFKRLFVA
jgi:cellulose synthase/poly-beta-1,6-N-acetylglucosamine synthase-like glycosyltransferase